ncbi:PASTA domain-containing protein [Granulosicoccus antarcticus]|uniref:PASTA domain-containing protein n=1 Tax=Granulosicoccus antarcticus IMCC3135 TaxID=1192854 RepID=A0A2Z2NLE4_9GAMM|nr:PASTA domain-containing protein [Granulosicoccus antarcticus]ASJ71983.1 hypothetical protein IMCC3135_09430 [Granulosicoccus antarcticus IMCC3135]
MDDQTLPQLLDDVPAALGELIGAVGRGVADAQQALDRSTIEQIARIYSDLDDDTQAHLRAIGYQPTWYKIPEATAELMVTLSVAGGDGVQHRSDTGVRLHATPVDANYANKYSFNLQAASKVTFKIVPVPPTAQAEEIRVVPHLDGRASTEAAQILDRLGIRHNLDDDAEGEVDSTSPSAGSMLGPDDVLTIKTRTANAPGAS